MSDVRIVRGRWVVTGGGDADRVITEGAVVVNGGMIEEVGDWHDIQPRYPDAEVIGSERMAVLPGLINAHHHSNGVTGLQHGVADDLLEPWILALAHCRPMDAYLKTLLSAAQLLRTGVTSVVDVVSGRASPEVYADRLGRALNAYDEAGMRVAFAPGIINRSHLVAGEDESFLAALPADIRALAERRLPADGDLDEDDYFGIIDDLWTDHRAHPRIDIWFAPPGPQWVSDDFMQRIAERAAARDTGIQTHVTESVYEKLHGPRSYGKPTMEHLRDLGVLGPRFSIAHGVWLTEGEIAIMAETGAALSHNPSSNLRLRAGIAPLNALRCAGVTVGIGMDGTTLNDDEDYFTEMRLAMRLHRTPFLGAPAPTPAGVLEMATAGGARLMRKEGSLGRLAAGYRADLVLVDLGRITWPWVAPEADPRDLVLNRARAGDVDTVLIDGEIVYCEGRPVRFDVEEVGREFAAMLSATPFPADSAQAADALIPRIVDHYSAWEMPELAPYTTYNSRR